MTFPHIPIMAPEWLTLLEERKITHYLDGTLGAGGHAEAVLKAHPEIETFYGIDQDESALGIARSRLSRWEKKLQLIHSNFASLKELNLPPLDAILLDLGVSSMQLDQGDRGFSFRLEGPLDMRMNRSQEISAATIVNTYSEQQIGRIIRDYGEEKFWRPAARAIVKARPMTTTLDLAKALEGTLHQKKKGIHPATKVFQGLRIAVNSELEVLQEVLPQAIQLLRKGGILGIITFHSLEDRIVKNVFRDDASTKESTSGLAGLFLDKEALVRPLSRKPLTPSDAEIEQNPRSRSAKLRVVEKIV